jgi:hypothetical protein
MGLFKSKEEKEAIAKEKNNTDLNLRLIEEAKWGIDFIMKTRFGNGFI